MHLVEQRLQEVFILQRVDRESRNSLNEAASNSKTKECSEAHDSQSVFGSSQQGMNEVPHVETGRV